MRRLLAPVFLALALAALAAGAGSATTLPSSEVPNGPGLALPANWTSPPVVPERRTYEQLLALWKQAGGAYGIPWQVLGAINKVESDFGRNMGPSSAGALGWMQFMPSTWLRWGTDANGDGVASPWNPEDAVYSAARYLAAAGGRTDIERGVFAYNHAQWYVDEVMQLASLFGADGSGFASGLDTSLFTSGFPTAPAGPKLVFKIDDIDRRLADARKRVSRAQQAVVAIETEGDSLEWRIVDAQTKAGEPSLSRAQFKRVNGRIRRLAALQSSIADRTERMRARLDYEVTRLDELRKESRETQAVVTFTRPDASPALGGATTIGKYVFPVGGGPGRISVGHTHHDYPAADIAAPEGSPVFALTNAVVVAAWPSPAGLCGIGMKIHADDGHDYVYCHLSYLEPSVVPGAALAPGAPVGLVGQTGHATGPHLHLQFSPATAYPQQEAWFAAFAGRAFSWQDAPTPRVSSDAASGPVFEVVD